MASDADHVDNLRLTARPIMKICHLTTVHDWNDVRIFVKMCRSAVADGFRVDLVAPVAPGNPVVDSGGVTVHPLRKYRSRLLRSSLGTLRAIPKAIGARATVYHVHDPELLPLVLTLKLLQRRVVFDFHEEFSAQIRSKTYVRRRWRNIASAAARCWEFLLCWSATRVVAATPRIRDRLPLRRARAVTVCNYPTLEEFPSPSSTPFAERPRVAYYVGGVTATRGCHEMIAAGRILAASGSGITVRIAGPFDSPDLERSVRRAAAGSNTCFLGRRTRDEVVHDLGAARVGIVVLRRTPNHVNSLPVKMFEYMAAGIPVVASDFPLWKRIVSGANCGLTVDSRDPRKIADAVSQVVDDPDFASRMGASGRRAVEAEYQWNTQWRLLRRFYRIASGRRSRKASSKRTAPHGLPV